jgi:hypothetical protein
MNGVEPLVPPTVWSVELMTSGQPGAISANALTSGTPRWFCGFTPSWYAGRGWRRLSAPPPAELAPNTESFHTVSETRVLPGPSASRVPPTAVTKGETAGKDSVVPLTLVPHVVDPESPAATNEDTPVSAIMAKTASTTEVYPGSAVFSAMEHAPYETEMTSGTPSGSPTARLNPSRTPLTVLCTSRSCAPGATAATV